MRKQVLIAAAALSLAGAVGGGAVALAQGAGPSPTGPADAGPGAPPPPPQAGVPGGPHERAMMWWHHHGPMDRRMGERPFMPGTFSLFYRQRDRKLSQADVQEIAQAILLWNGQHTWKVANVQALPDHAVSFSYTAPDGTVIARFNMDQQTGRITRTG